MRPIAWFVTLALSVTLLQFIDSVSSESANANTPLTVSGFCRSTDGTGTTEEITPSKNGFYQSLASRASDEIDGLRITPIFSKRLYVDFSKNFDATYISYQLENTTNTAMNNLQIVLGGFDGTEIAPVTSADLTATVSVPAATTSGGVTTFGKAVAYFMVRAKSVTTTDQLHEVRVFNSSGVQQLGCKTAIKGVQRSLAAQANKVTAISVSTTKPVLGQTFTVQVTGAPGLIGSGADPDLSIMAMSPGTNSLWPTKAIRLEAVSLALRGFKGTTTSTECELIGATFDKPTKTATWTNTLVIRGLQTCADTNKHTYVATYTFRLIGTAATNPVIRPLSSIASGTQVKYTGSLPSVDVEIPITNAVTPNVVKTFVSCATVSTNVQVSYRVTISTPAGATVGQNILIDKIRDLPASGGTFVSGTYTDASVGSTSISKTDVTVDGKNYWDFAPASKFSLSTATSIVLNYVVSYPKPGTGSVSYTNRAFAYYGDIVVASGDTITGIKTDISSAGQCLTSRDDTPIDKVAQTITFDPPTSLGAGTTTVLSAYSDSGLKVTLSSTTPTICTITEFNGVYSVYTITEGANCIIRATQAGDTKFAAATPVDKTIAILKGQVITYTAGIFNTNTTTTVQVQATSKLKVLLTSVDTAVCTVSVTEAVAYNSTTGSTTYTINKGIATGSCILNATQFGGSTTVDSTSTTWGPAPSRDIVIGVGTPQYIDFSAPAPGTSYTTSTTSFSAVATAKRTSDNAIALTPVYFTSNTPSVCAIAGSTSAEAVSGYNSSTGATTVTVNILGPGTCELAANQDGLKDDGTDSGYASAPEVLRTISITGTGRTVQTLAIVDPGSKTYGDADFLVQSASKKADATATGLLVAISTSTPTVCQVGSSTLVAGVTQTTLRLLSAGDCIVLANQAGDNTYSLATQVTRTITISVKTLTITGLSATKEYDGTTAVSFSGTAKLSGVVIGDGLSELSLDGSASGDYPEAEVGADKSITVTGFTISGSKAESYSLSALTITGSITQKPITIKFSDVTVNRTGTPVCSVSAVVVTSGELVSGQTLDSIACSPFPAKTDGAMQNGDYTITPSLAVIKASSLDKTSNYLVSYASGTLTVSGKKVPELIVESTTIVYGLADSSLETAPKQSDTAGGIRAKDRDSNTLLDGSLSYKLPNGAAVGKTLPVGTHVLTVVFTPADGIKSTYDNAQSTRTVIVKPRRLTLGGITAVSKVYDGTKSATVSGTASLTADPVAGSNDESEGYGLGVLTEDLSGLSIAGEATVEFTSADAGSSITVNYSGRTLAGTKADNYVLKDTIALSANITKRKLTVDLASYHKVYDGNKSISTTGASLVALPVGSGGDGGGVVPGDDVEIDLAASGVDVISAELNSASVGEDIPLTLSGGKLKGTKSGNYELASRTGLTAHVLKRKITMSGLTPQNKIYDGTKTAAVSESSVQLVALAEADGGNVSCNVSDAGCGVVEVDAGLVALDGVASYEFESATVGESKPISFTGKNLTGTRSGNYELVAPRNLAANITHRKVRVALGNYSKVYDGTESLTPTSPSLVPLAGADAATSGVVQDDDVAIDLAASGADELLAGFDTAEAGSSKTVTISGGKLSGNHAGNYQLQATSVSTGVIHKRKLTIVGLTGQNKIYDGTTTAEISEENASLMALSGINGNVSCDESDPDCGVIPADQGNDNSGNPKVDWSRNPSQSFNFEDDEAGSSKVISIPAKELTGSRSQNYELVTPTEIRATIQKRRVTIDLPSYQKVYDGNKTLSTTGASLEALPAGWKGDANAHNKSGVIAKDLDKVELDSSAPAGEKLLAEFASKNVGETVAINLAQGKLSGTRSSNYQIELRDDLIGKIIPRPITFETLTRSKLAGALDPSFNYNLLSSDNPDTGFAQGENADTIGISGLTREAGTTAGKYKISLQLPSPGQLLARDNYDVTVNEDYLYIAEADVEVTEPALATDETIIDCGCSGLKPGSEVELTVEPVPVAPAARNFSAFGVSSFRSAGDFETTETTQSTSTTGIITDAGTCPLLLAKLAAGQTGKYTITLIGEYPNSQPLSYQQLLTLTSGTDPIISDPDNPPPGDSSGTPSVGGGYKITLHYPRGMTGPKELIYPVGAQSLELPKLKKNGFKFKGWSQEQVTRKGVKVIKGVSQDIDLYSVWRLLPLKSKVFFGPDSPLLTQNTKDKLDSLYRQMKRQSQKAVLVVDGWVKKTSDTSYSVELSKDRARNVANYLRSLGAKVSIREIKPNGVHPRVNNKARKAEIRIFFSGANTVKTLKNTVNQSRGASQPW